MRNIRFAGILVLMAVMLVMAFSAQAASIRLDENFDGASIFVNQNWAYGDRTTTVTGGPCNPTSLTLGVNLAFSDTGSKKSDTLTQEGAVSTERAFSGTKSYKLEAGQKLGVAVYNGDGNDNQPYMQQLALAIGSTDGIAEGEKIGGFQLDFATVTKDGAAALVGARGTANMHVYVDAISQGPGLPADIVVSADPNTLTKKTIGTIDPAKGSWANLAILTKMNYDNATTVAGLTATANKWGAWDPTGPKYDENGDLIDGEFTTRTKGPVDLYHGGQTTTSLYYTGVSIFLNSKAKAAYLSPLDIDAKGKWGTWTAENHQATHTTYVRGFAVSAVEGTMYVDDLLFGFPPNGKASFGSPNDQNYISQEMAIRMNEFTDKGGEAADAAAKDWTVY